MTAWRQTQHDGELARRRCGTSEIRPREVNATCEVSEEHRNERPDESCAAAPRPVTAAAQGSAHMTKTEMLQLGTKTTWVRLSSGQATYYEMTVLRFELDEVSISHRKERVAVHHILRLWSTWARSNREREIERTMKSHGI